MNRKKYIVYEDMFHHIGFITGFHHIYQLASNSLRLVEYDIVFLSYDRETILDDIVVFPRDQTIRTRVWYLDHLDSILNRIK